MCVSVRAVYIIILYLATRGQCATRIGYVIVSPAIIVAVIFFFYYTIIITTPINRNILERPNQTEEVYKHNEKNK